MKRGIRALVVALAWMLWGCSELTLSPPGSPLVPERGGVIANVTLIEPGVDVRVAKTLVIESGAIAAIRDASRSERASPRRFVLPGLVDMHVHQPLDLSGLPDYFALLYLRHGVTSVRYTGHSNTGDAVERHIARIAGGEIPGPRGYSCGPMIDGEPAFWETAVSLVDPSRAADVVDDLARRGVDCIKVYSNLEPEALAAVAAAARAHSLYVVGHVPHGVAFETSGIQDVQHLIGLPGRVAVDRVNPMLDGWFGMSPERLREIAVLSRRNDIAHTPTLVFLWTNANRDRHDQLANETPAHLLPRLFSEVAWQPQPDIRLGGQRTAETQDRFRAAFELALEAVGTLYRAGVRIHAGTDTGNPFVIQGAALIKELELLTQAGLSIEDALATATTVPARALTPEVERLIAVGGAADLVVLNEDPRLDLAALDRIDTVVADGRFYSAAFLDAEIARYRRHHENFMWETVLPVLAEALR